MQIAEFRQPGVVVVVPMGRIDSTTSSALEQHLLGLLHGAERRLVVDFVQADYISSAGLRVMLILAKRIKETQGGRLVLCGFTDSVRQVFDLAGFLRLFAIEASRDEAIARVVAP